MTILTLRYLRYDTYITILTLRYLRYDTYITILTLRYLHYDTYITILILKELTVRCCEKKLTKKKKRYWPVAVYISHV